MPDMLYIPRPMLSKIRLSWRLASAVIVMVCAMGLLHAMSDASYYVYSINLAGATLVVGDEIYQKSGVNGENLFWLDPNEIEERIRAVPGVQEATVSVEWPVAVDVQVVEQEPVIVWEQGDERSWVDARGEVFPIRLDIPLLLPIVVDDSDSAAGLEVHIAPEVVTGVLQLKDLRPSIERIHFDSVYGVSYQDGQNRRGYFGTGSNMDLKLMVYDLLIEHLLERGVHPTVVNVADLEIPYYQE